MESLLPISQKLELIEQQPDPISKCFMAVWRARETNPQLTDIEAINIMERIICAELYPELLLDISI